MPAGGAMSKRLRGLKIAGQVVLGLGLGLVIAELAFSWRDEGAFPHANFYVPDAALGVRLAPGATMGFKLRENPRTTIHVNSRGYRGGEWAAPGEDEVIVVGDSQVFGLGVEDDATFSAGLARHAGRAVINAGVPTYGPAEYMAVARELVVERKAKTVVVALNFVNDPFELGRPNSERHAVWDGWAVRSETAPASVAEFPGRLWLFSQSHAVYALRRWLHARGAAAAPDGAELGDPLDFGTPSEGGMKDLVHASKQAHEEVLGAHRAAARAMAGSQVRLAQVDAELATNREQVVRLVFEESDYRFPEWRQQIAKGQPGDIVQDESSEASRSIVLTAEMIRQATIQRDKLIGDIMKGPAKELVAAEKMLEAERVQLRERIAAGVPAIPRPASQFRGYLQEFKEMCEEHGAELVVVALPIDVQVDRGEWAKYGVSDGPDMHESLVLIDDLVADARALGLRAFDATGVLRSAQPGAFLDHDIHMTAKGHAALAEGLAYELSRAVPPPLKMPGTGLPEGRSFAPTPNEWDRSGSIYFEGGSDVNCHSNMTRDWLHIRCPRAWSRSSPEKIEVIRGGSPATMVMSSGDGVTLVTPVVVGEPLTARLFLKDAVWDFALRWTPDGIGAKKPWGRFTLSPDAARPVATPPSAAVAGLCKCYQELFPGRKVCEHEDPEVPVGMPTCREGCSDLWGDPRLAEVCASTFPDSCVGRLACAQNDPLFAPTCPEGQVHAFASNLCFAACDEAHPCSYGECVAWQGGSVCR